MQESPLKKIYLIPNAITAFSLVCGLFVIFRTSVADPSRDLFGLLQASAILILIAAIADLADGAVARMIGGQSEFGGQFDSLADAVSFGVAPPLLVLKSLTGGEVAPGPLLIFFVIIASMIYTLCGVLRLVRYNVRSKAEQEQGKAKHFTGLPIPAAASAAVSAALFLVSPFVFLSVTARAVILTLMLVVVGYFMVSRWKFPSVKALHFRVPSFYLVIATGIFAVLVLYGILDYFALAYFATSWIYLLIAWSISLFRVIVGKKSPTLSDFDPD